MSQTACGGKTAAWLLVTQALFLGNAVDDAVAWGTSWLINCSLVADVPLAIPMLHRS